MCGHLTWLTVYVMCLYVFLWVFFRFIDRVVLLFFNLVALFASDLRSRLRSRLRDGHEGHGFLRCDWRCARPVRGKGHVQQQLLRRQKNKLVWTRTGGVVGCRRGRPAAAQLQGHTTKSKSAVAVLHRGAIICGYCYLLVSHMRMSRCGLPQLRS